MNTIKTTRSPARKILVRSGWVLATVVLVAGMVYGPEIVGLLRVSNEIDKISSEAELVGGPWPRSADACLYCHDGLEGNAGTQTYPRLAGQTEGYLRKQLADFASGEREDPTMTPFALSLSEREFDAIVAHFSKMKPQPNKTFHADPVRVQRGEALAKASNCAACHGQQLEGKGEFPRLAGQGVDYLAEQLAHFKNGARRDSTGAMPAIAGTLSQQDIEDLAHYAASR